MVLVPVMAVRFGDVELVGADDDDAATHIQHVDLGPVQLAEARAGQHVGGVPIAQRPSTRYSTRSTNGRIGLMSWVTNNTAVRACVAPVVDQCAHDTLLRQVEGQQWLVAQQQLRIGDERLPRRVSVAVHRRTRCRSVHPRTAAPRPLRWRRDASPDATAGQRDAEPVPVDAELHEVTAPDRQIAVERALLGDVADRAVAPSRRLAVDLHDARRRPDQAEQGSQECGLPEPLGPRIARNSPGGTSRSRCSNTVRAPYRTVVVAEPDDRHRSGCQGGEERLQLVQLPGLVVGCVLREGLGHADDRNAVATREIADVLGDPARCL